MFHFITSESSPIQILGGRDYTRAQISGGGTTAVIQEATLETVYSKLQGGLGRESIIKDGGAIWILTPSLVLPSKSLLLFFFSGLISSLPEGHHRVSH